MKKIIKYKVCIIPILFVLVCLLTFLFGKTRTNYTMPGLEKQTTEYLREDAPYTAVFVPFHENLYSISIEPNEQYEAEGSIEVTLYNSLGEKLASDEKDCRKINFGYLNEYELQAKVTPGEEYTIEVTPHGCDDVISLSVVDHTVLLKNVTYKAPITKRGMLPYIVIYGLLSIVLILAVDDRKALSVLGKASVYAFFVIIATAIILMNDEAKEPLRYTGTELNHNSGYEDYRGYLSFNQDENSSGESCSSEKYYLLKGEYVVGLSYLTGNEGNWIDIVDDGVVIQSFDINPVATYGEYTFKLNKDTQNTEIKVYFSGQGVLKVNELSLKVANDGYFYSDSYFFLAVFWILNIVGVCLYFRNKKKPINRQLMIDALILVMIAVCGIYPFLNSDLAAADDLAYHMNRIEGIKDTMLDGQFPAVIMPNALSGNGFLNSMYPYLFLYIPATLRLFNVSIVLAYKVMIFLATFATATLTYIAIKSVCNRRSAALLGATLYVMLPYRFNNIYARGDVGESLAMTFIPFLLAAIYHMLIGDKKKWYWLVIAMSCILECHIISFVVACIIVTIPCLLFFRELLKEKRWLNLIKAAVMSVLLNAIFVIPFVWFYFNEDMALTALDYFGFSEYTCDPAFFLNMIGSTDYRYLSFGIPVGVVIIFGIIHLLFERKKDDTRELYLGFWFVVGLLLTLLLTAYGASDNLKEVYVIDKLFRTMQYPKRLFGQSSAMFIFAGSMWIAESEMLEKANIRKTLIIVLTVLCGFVGMKSLYKFENYSTTNYTDTYTAGHETKVKGFIPMAGLMRYPYEYRINGVDESVMMNYYFVQAYETTNIISCTKSGTSYDVIYTATDPEADIILPVMDYHGYQAYNDNQPVEIYKGKNYAIKCKLIADGQQHTLSIRYEMPAMFSAGAWISVFSFVVFIGFGIYKGKKKVKVNTEE